MSVDLLTNPSVIGAIIGAVIGAITSVTFGMAISQYKFNKRKKGAKALISSEINYIINALEDFRDKYVKEEITDMDNKKIIELINFYNIMSNFPILTNRNWVNLISFIPSIFKEEEIDKINQFYIKCGELTDVANALADEKPPNIGGYLRGEIDADKLTSFKTVNNHRNMFRNDLNELIKLGEDIEKIFH